MEDDIRDRSAYRIAIVTALPAEFAAMEVMLDGPGQDMAIPGDPMSYLVGAIGSHKVVVTLLPEMGNNTSAAVASHLLRSFPSVSDILMVGIAGGVPNPTKAQEHVRLGDLVISRNSGVKQFDFGKAEIVFGDGEPQKQFKIRASDPPPSAHLQQTAAYLEARRIGGKRPWEAYIDRATALENASRPPDEADVLRDSKDPSQIVAHPEDLTRRPGQPKLHYGMIGSSNAVIKNPRIRDRLRDDWGVRAIEMEGSGIATAGWIHGRSGYLLIRGICDYCDSNKNDEWQLYAAVVAAAYARALVESIPLASMPPRPRPPDLHQAIEPALRRDLIETLARVFPTRAKITGLVGEALQVRLPTTLDDPSAMFETVVQHCEAQRGESFGRLLDRAVDFAPAAHELKRLRSLLVHHGYIPESMRHLDETIPGGFYIVNGAYVDANGNSVNPPPRFRVLEGIAEAISPPSINIDARPLFGNDERWKWSEPYEQLETVQELLDSIHRELNTRHPGLRAGVFGDTWLLRDPRTGNILTEMGRDWANTMGKRADTRRLDEIGFQPNVTIEVVPVVVG
jgi:nucleoside phosphorylase